MVTMGAGRTGHSLRSVVKSVDVGRPHFPLRREEVGGCAGWGPDSLHCKCGLGGIDDIITDQGTAPRVREEPQLAHLQGNEV